MKVRHEDSKHRLHVLCIKFYQQTWPSFDIRLLNHAYLLLFVSLSLVDHFLNQNAEFMLLRQITKF